MNGRLRPIIIDDYIPIQEDTGEPVFCKSKNKCVWAILLEKAWAKLNRSYTRSASCYPNYSSIFLTGAPAEYYPHNLVLHENSKQFSKEESEKFWQHLKLSLSSQHSLIANGSLSVSDDKIVGK